MNKEVIQRNNVNVTGSGEQPMLFAHGFGCDQNMWRFVTPAFQDTHKIVLFDYVGAGRSDLSAYNQQRYSSLYGYAQDVIEVCEALHLRDVIFVGHSVSSMIGLLAAIQKPALFKKLIMVGPSPCYINDAEYTGGFSREDISGLLKTMDQNYIGWANFLAPAIMGNENNPELGKELAQSFCSTDPTVARQFAEVTFFSDNRRDLQNAPVPSLIIQCTNDIIAPLSVGEYLSRELPHSTLAILKATGHCPHMSAPEETVAKIREYLSLAA
jgi:sigma-B regulation protein RsbQ